MSPKGSLSMMSVESTLSALKILMSHWRMLIGEDDLIRPEWQERTHNLEEFVEDDQDKNPQCDICGKFYNTRKQLYNHKQTHENENSNCDNCDKYSSTKIKLLTHKKTVHNDQKKLCEKCTMTFTAKKSVKAHEVIHHEKKIWRTVCQKPVNIRTYKSHEKSCRMKYVKQIEIKYVEQNSEKISEKTSEKIYPCDQCTKNFKCKKLLGHM